MLQIGELARFAGVSTRTVRFYHQRGLLAEPERDASGYRRYDAEATVRLVRIVELAKAGVPLARIQDLLASDPETFRAEIDQIDEGVREQIRHLQEVRRALRTLHSPDRVALPDDVAAMIGKLRSSDAPSEVVDQVRDSWIVSLAVYPTEMREWLDSPGGAMVLTEDSVSLIIRTLELAHSAPDDPRIAQLVHDHADWLEQSWRTQSESFEGRFADQRLNAMMYDPDDMTPAWLAITERLTAELARRGLPTDSTDWQA